MNQEEVPLSNPINIYTIGFTKKSAEEFFALLINANVRRVVDVRLNNLSQLAGFSKKPDLEFFLRTIGGIEYCHLLELAPTPDLFAEYKKRGGDWRSYENKFLQLIEQRKIEEHISPDWLDQACLLCSEPTPTYCHRRLVAEYLQSKWCSAHIVHL